MQQNGSLKRPAAVSDAEPPQKRRRLPRGVQGVYAADMSLVTPENGSSRSGWRITPLGRLVRPMRMRPEHPLPLPTPTVRSVKVKGQVPGKPKRKVRDPPSRARRRTIDPTKFGSQHLKGVFLDAQIVTSRQPAEVATTQSIPQAAHNEDMESQDDEEEGEEEFVSTQLAIEKHQERRSQEMTTPSTFPSKATMSNTQRDAWAEELDQEKKKSLGLLRSLFGNKGDEDWGGQELDSDVEVDAVHDDPADMGVEEEAENTTETEDFVEETRTEAEVCEPSEAQPTSSSKAVTVPAPVQVTKLKDLFAPREDEGASYGHMYFLTCDLILNLCRAFIINSRILASGTSRSRL